MFILLVVKLSLKIISSIVEKINTKDDYG